MPGTVSRPPVPAKVKVQTAAGEMLSWFSRLLYASELLVHVKNFRKLRIRLLPEPFGRWRVDDLLLFAGRLV